jgi:hypothetical protein
MNIALKTNWASGEWAALTQEQRTKFWHATVFEVRRDGILMGKFNTVAEAIEAAEHGDTITEYTFMKSWSAPDWVPSRSTKQRRKITNIKSPGDKNA